MHFLFLYNTGKCGDDDTWCDYYSKAYNESDQSTYPRDDDGYVWKGEDTGIYVYEVAPTDTWMGPPARACTHTHTHTHNILPSTYQPHAHRLTLSLRQKFSSVVGLMFRVDGPTTPLWVSAKMMIFHL